MRKCPEKSATLFSVGTKKKGNDGNMWVIVKNKNGVKRWQKKTNKTVKKSLKKSSKVKKSKLLTSKKYFIFDNGGRPYKVVTKGNDLDIFTYDDSVEDVNYDDYPILIKSYRKLKKIFIPKGIDDRGNPWSGGKGNTILAQISGNKYLFIGPWIYEFETKGENIVEYHSQVGNSGVPYPLAVGENNVYFLISKGLY